MDHRRLALVSALFAVFSAPVLAGYAVPADPPGFARGGPWGSGFGYATNAANDQTFGRIVHQPGGVKVPIPGGHTTMPASYRFAQNAPKFAARIVFAHPGLRTAAGIATWLGIAQLIWDESEGVWKKIGSAQSDPDGYIYRHAVGFPWHNDMRTACEDGARHWESGSPKLSIQVISTDFSNNRCKVKKFYDGQDVGEDWISVQKEKSDLQCPPGWQKTPAGCVSPALTQPQFEEELAPAGQPSTMPETVPGELPYPSPLPIDPAPSPWINPEPGPNPQTRPRFVPSGDPVPNPKYDPNAEPSPQNQPFIQPGVRIQPSPTPQEPFRVDIQPVDKPLPTPEPEAEQDEGPGQNPNTKPQENPGLCDQYPDILACGKMDDVSPEEVNDEQKTISINPEPGWGAENSACPAPKTATVHGIGLEMSWQPFCDFATGIRPVVIAMAWVSAFLLVLGVSRRES